MIKVVFIVSSINFSCMYMPANINYYDNGGDIARYMCQQVAPERQELFIRVESTFLRF